ncbi:MAG: hypothetical protein QM784_26740 [Polyangiaceae bacterium]
MLKNEYASLGLERPSTDTRRGLPITPASTSGLTASGFRNWASIVLGNAVALAAALGAAAVSVVAALGAAALGGAAVPIAAALGAAAVPLGVAPSALPV